MQAIMYRLRGWAAIARSDRGILTFGADEADAILAALERAERVEKAAMGLLVTRRQRVGTARRNELWAELRAALESRDEV